MAAGRAQVLQVPEHEEGRLGAPARRAEGAQGEVAVQALLLAPRTNRARLVDLAVVFTHGVRY